MKIDGSSNFYIQENCIDIIKEVSVDGGINWFDANSMEEAPGTTNGVQYRFTVSNCGQTDLTNAMITDPYLGITEAAGTVISIGDLPAGGTPVVVTVSDAPQLDQPALCSDVPPPGVGDPNKFNEATVVAETGLAAPNDQIEDTDPAWVKCVCIDVEKLVSVDGGISFTDSDSCEEPPTALNGVEYQLVVSNCGSVVLEDVVLDDPLLFGPQGYFLSGDLLPGVENQVMIGKNEEPRLAVEDFCAVFADSLDPENNLPNTAVAEGVARLVNADVLVSDSDSACVNCPDFTAAIGDYVWNDLDQDGIQDAGEMGISGVTVNLTDCDGNLLATTTTDADGYYQFTVAPGDYQVQFVLPSGYAFSPQDQGADDTLDSDANANGMTMCTTLDPGETDLSWDAGMYAMDAIIGDYVWNDANQNGIQDAGEMGISGVTVNLIDCADNIVMATTTTDADGYYQFIVAPGDYQVQFVLPTGYAFSPQDQGADDTLDSDAGANGMTMCTTLDPGETDLSWDAGMYAMDAVIGDYVWNDANQNGIQDAGEMGIVGVTVNVTDCDGNLVATTTTDAVGYYQFIVAPGDYQVQFVLPTGYAFSPQDQGADDTLDSDADANGMTMCTTLEPGETDLSWDAGMYAMDAVIGDYVWNDANQNGIQDAGEMGISGVTVNLTDCDGNFVATTTTDADGYYQFTVAPGDYRVEFVLPAGYAFSPQDQGTDDTLDSDPDANGLTVCTTLEPGETDLSWDAGLYEPTPMIPSIDVEKEVSTDGENWFDADEAPGINVAVCPDQSYDDCDKDSDWSSDSYWDNDSDCEKDSYWSLDSYWSKDSIWSMFSYWDKDSDCDSDSDWSMVSYWDKDSDCDCASSWDKCSDCDDSDCDDSDCDGSDCDGSDCDGSDCDGSDCESNVFFHYTVINDGPVTLTNLTLTDNIYSTSSCVVPAELLPGESFECTIGPFAAEAGQHTNTATATGEYQTATVMDTDDANYYGCIGEGTGTPGYWMNHPEAWPVEVITIGGVEYSKDEAIALMKAPVKLDKTYTMFPALVSAKLNVLSCNVSYCIDETIAAADDWMAEYGPVGSGVPASSTAWEIGEPLYIMLDDYNNGLLCAPSRDILEKDSYDSHDGDDSYDSYDRYDSYDTKKGAKSLGHWSNKDKSWPTSYVRLGGKYYSRDEADSKLKTASDKDVTYKMFHALAVAKLNIADGCEKSCIEDTIKEADSWLEKNGPAGTEVSTGSWAWKVGRSIYHELDDYNNGKMCADFEDGEDDLSTTWWSWSR